MQKNKRRMDDISDEFHRKRGICCVSCWSDEYRALAKKKERQELRYWQLYNKITIHESPQGDDQLIDELIRHYRERIRGLYFEAQSIRSKGYEHYAHAGSRDTKRFRLLARLQKILRRIAPTHPLGHLEVRYSHNFEVPVYTPPRSPDLPLFGEE